MSYIKNFAIGFDQWVNTWFAGWPDETLSSRSFRAYIRASKWYHKIPKILIDALFMLVLQKNHCYESYISEAQRKHFPMSLRSKSRDIRRNRRRHNIRKNMAAFRKGIAQKRITM